jgi:hypothetical protein
LPILSFYNLTALWLFLSWLSPKLQNIPSRLLPLTDSLFLSKDILCFLFVFFLCSSSQPASKKERKKERD